MARTIPSASPRKGSVTGFVLAVFSLILSAIGSGLVHAHYKVQPSGSKVGDAVATGTTHVISSLIGVPFLVGGIALLLLAAVFILIRLRKGLSGGGLVASVLSILICIWSFSLATGAFRLLKAH